MGSRAVSLVEEEVRLAANARRGPRAEGFVVDVRNNGTDGPFNAEVNTYDGVVLDIMLPGSTAMRRVHVK